MIQTDIQKTVQTYFLRRPDIHTVILYGSVTEEYFSPDSDVDLAAAADRLLTPEERVDIHQALEKRIGRRVDLRDLSTLHGVILQQVLCNGRVVKKENPEYFEEKLREMVFYMQDIVYAIVTGKLDTFRNFMQAVLTYIQ
jgi:predicted nucleotidyltransferase